LLVVNGRCLTLRPTGMERYAREVLARLPLSTTMAVSPNRPLYGLRGYLWEQAMLPRHVSGRDLLWSPANSGPLRVKNQVVTIHDMAVFDHGEWFSSSVRLTYRCMLPLLAARARHVVTDSEFSKRRIVRHLKVAPEKVSVIYPGVTRPALRVDGTDAVPRSGSGAPYAIAYGGNNPRKNVARLIEAWRLLGGRLPELRLKIYGGASSVFKGAAAAVSGTSVDILGYVPDAELTRLYKDASVLVYPSLYEGFGLPPLEAMAFGVPTVISDIAVFRETYDGAAEFVDPYDPVDIARGVASVVTDGALRARLVLASSHLVGHYGWERTAERLMHLMQEIDR
jgi:glycosyltransferase involved in cell wall biosynthesis